MELKTPRCLCCNADMLWICPKCAESMCITTTDDGREVRVWTSRLTREAMERQVPQPDRQAWVIRTARGYVGQSYWDYGRGRRSNRDVPIDRAKIFNKEGIAKRECRAGESVVRVELYLQS